MADEQMDSLVAVISLKGFDEIARQLTSYNAALQQQLKATKETLDASENKWKSHNESVSSGISTVGSTLKKLAGAAGIGLSLGAIVAGLKSATAEANRFEEQWEQVETRLSSADLPMAGLLKSQVQDLSRSFNAPIEQMVEGLATIVDATYAPAESIAILEDSSILAKGGLMQVGAAATDVTTILRAFNLPAEQSGRVIDAIANAADRGRGPISAFSGGIAGMARFASDSGLSLNELAGIFATTTAKGEPLERTLAALRLILRELTSEDEKAVEAKKRLGIEIENGRLKSGQFLEIIQKLATASNEEVTAIVGEGRARGTLNLLLSSSAELTRNATVEMERSGTAHEKAALAMAGTEDKFKAVGLAAGEMGRSLGAGIAELLDKSGMLDGLASSLTLVARALKELSYAGSVDLLRTDVASAVKNYNDQRTSLEDLVKKHSELTAALSAATPGTATYTKLQNELYGVIEDITAIVPEARDDISEYGSAFGVNIDKVRQFTQAQRDLLQINLQIKESETKQKIAEGKDRYKEASDDLKKYESELAKYDRLISDLKTKGFVSQETIDQMGQFRGGLVRITDLLSPSEKMISGFGKAQDQLREKILKCRQEMLEQERAEAVLKIVQADLNKLLQAGKISQEEFDRAVKAATESVKSEAAGAQSAAVAVDALAAAQKKHQDIIGGIDWSTYYGDQERLSGKTTNQIVDDIDRLLEKYEQEGATGSKAYKELADLRVEYAEKGIEAQIKAEEDARQRIVDIWNGVNEDIKSAMSDGLADMFTGESDFGDALSSLGDRIKESFAHGFSEALIEKSGFDLKFKNNMLDLGGFASSIFGGGAGGGGGLLGGLGSMFTSITDAIGITTPAAQEFGTAAADIADEAAVMDAELTDSAGAIAETGDAATKAAPALTKAGQGIAGLNLALPATGIYLAAITGQLGETAQGFSKIGTYAAIGAAALGPLGALLGGVGGAMAEFAHNTFGIGGQHITFEEEFDSMLKRVQAGELSQEELFKQTYLRMGNYANDFWGTQDELIGKSYAERKAYYDKFANLKDAQGVSLFSEDQLSKLRDALQLFETVEERSAAAGRTASEMARQVFDTKIWETFKDMPYLIDEIGGVGDAFSQAFTEAQATGADFTEVFRAKLMELPGISQEAMNLVLEAFGMATEEIATEIEVATGGFRDMWAQTAQGIAEAGAGAEDFFKNVQDVSGMWLQGWDIDIHDALMQIPGMTGEVKNAIMEELRGLKEAGATEFQLGEAFKQSVTDALNDPTLMESASGLSDMLRTVFSGIGSEPIEMGQIFDTTQIKAFIAQLKPLKGQWGGITDAVQSFRAELEASGQTAENAGEEIYKNLRNNLSEIPGVTQEMVQTMERLLRSGDWQVLIDISEQGLDEVLRGLNRLPEEVNIPVTATREGPQGRSPGFSAADLINNFLSRMLPPSIGAGSSPQIPAAAAEAAAGVLSSHFTPAATGKTGNVYHLHFDGLFVGTRQDWDAVARNHLKPALDSIEARG